MMRSLRSFLAKLGIKLPWHWVHNWEANPWGLNWVRRLLLKIAVGSFSKWSTYDYMVRTLAFDSRLPRCKLADIVVRQDGQEKRIEADWLKTLAKICIDQPKHKKFPKQTLASNNPVSNGGYQVPETEQPINKELGQ